MNRSHRPASCARSSALGLALTSLLMIASTACGENSPDELPSRGRGPLVSPFDEITACEPAVFRGPQTPLYSNRPYHTAQSVHAARGLSFCRGARHGTNVWIVDISRATTLVAFGTSAFGLERRGWQASPDPVRVEAAGVVFDRVYTRRIEPGRYVIRQGFTPSAPIVLWEPEAVRPAR
jgi:hypothetical protein